MFLETSKHFEQGKSYSVIIEYEGKISTGNTGVYCAIDPDTLKKHSKALEQVKFNDLNDLHLIEEDPVLKADIIDNSIFCTTMAPVDARTFMPCLDEPSFKAKFQLTLNLSEAQVNHTAISNTPIASKDNKRISFEQTPLMSTYLLVCVIGKYEFVEVPMQRADGVKVRGYCPIGYAESIRHFV